MSPTRLALKSATRVAAGTLVIGCSGTSGASAAMPQELTVVSPDKIELTSGGAMKATVVVLNGGDAASVAFRVDADNSIVVTPTTAAVAANNVTRIPVTFKPAKSSINKASGQLIATASNRPPSVVPFELSPKVVSPSWALAVILVPLGVAVLFVLAAWLSLEPRPALDARLGPVNWDFSKSFASNLTVFSALLGTILSAGVLPKDLPAARVATYAGLNLLFGVAVIAGPFLYTACQGTEDVHRRGAVKEPQYQGYVGTFLVATIVTLWATGGEFATIAKLFGEIHNGGSLPELGLIAFEALIAIAAVALLILMWTRSRSILRAQTEPEKAKHRTLNFSRLQALRAPGIPVGGLAPTLEVADFVPELPAWTAF